MTATPPNCLAYCGPCRADSRCTCTPCREWRRKCEGAADRFRVPSAGDLVALLTGTGDHRPNLFRSGEFVLHSGQPSGWKIDADALTDADLATLAAIAAERLPPFGSVEGVPNGGLRFAEALQPHAVCKWCGHCWAAHCGHAYDIRSAPPTHCSQGCGCKAFGAIDSLLIAEDVVTTGASIERHRAGRDALGVAIFARGACPDWVFPLFTMGQSVQLPAAEAWEEGG